MSQSGFWSALSEPGACLSCSKYNEPVPETISAATEWQKESFLPADKINYLSDANMTGRIPSVPLAVLENVQKLSGCFNFLVQKKKLKKKKNTRKVQLYSSHSVSPHLE